MVDFICDSDASSDSGVNRAGENACGNPACNGNGMIFPGDGSGRNPYRISEGVECPDCKKFEQRRPLQVRPPNDQGVSVTKKEHSPNREGAARFLAYEDISGVKCLIYDNLTGEKMQGVSDLGTMRIVELLNELAANQQSQERLLGAARKVNASWEVEPGCCDRCDAFIELASIISELEGGDNA